MNLYTTSLFLIIYDFTRYNNFSLYPLITKFYFIITVIFATTREIKTAQDILKPSLFLLYDFVFSILKDLNAFNTSARRRIQVIYIEKIKCLQNPLVFFSSSFLNEREKKSKG